LCNLAVGATSIIPPKKDIGEEWQKIRKDFEVNVVSASPHYFSMFQSKLPAKHFKKIVIGGATIYPDFVAALKDQVYADSIQLVYGSTEAEPIATLTIDEYLVNNYPQEKGICVGKPHPNISIKVVEIKDGQLTGLNEGAIGEIIVAGPHVLKTYYKDPEAYTKNKIEYEGKIWHRTGDAGYLRKDNLYFYSRMKYCWNQEGYLLSPIVFEKFASEQGFNGEVTWLYINGETVAFYVGEKVAFEELLNEFPYGVDKVIRLKKLPKDKRHLSRVNYEGIIKSHIK